MKQFFILMLCLCGISAAYSQSASDKISVTIKAGKFTINKVNVTDGWMLNPVKATLGTEARRKEGYNITHTFDDLGISLFEGTNTEKAASGIINEVQFHFSAGEPNRVTPSDLYRGSMMVEGLKITRDLTPDVLKEKLPLYTETPSYMEHSHRLAYKGLYIYFLFNSDDTRLVKMSIGPAKD